MHELSLTRSMVDLVMERAEGHKVTRVRMRIGRLAGVEIEAVRFCFDVCTRETNVAGAELAIEEVPGRGVCASCGQEVPLEQLTTTCACGAYGLRVVAGEELMVVDMDVEDE